MTGSSMRRGLTLLASTGLLVAVVGVPAAAERCDRAVDASGQDVVQSGEVVCADEGGSTVLGVAEGGTFVGGPGSDRVVQGDMAGTFFGNGGDDSAARVSGRFFGGLGDDDVTVQLGTGGFFNGGPGDDSVVAANGTFIGAGGTDSLGTCYADVRYASVEELGDGCD